MMGWASNNFELSRGGVGQNMLPMEGLRGFAVFLVFLVHYCTLIGDWITPDSVMASWSGAIHTIGNVGVDLFFVLSGYLIYGSLISRKKPFIDFMRKRVARIYPAFCVVFVIYLCLSVAFSKESKIPPETYAAAVYLLQNFLLLPGLFPIDPLITVAWSLSYEMFYYLLIPAVIVLFGLRQRSGPWRTVFFLAVGTAFGAYCAMRGGPVRLMMFIAGIMVHEVLHGRRPLALSSRYAVLALVCGMLSMLLPLGGSAGEAVKILILAICFFVVCYSCFRHPDQGFARAFSWTPLRWLGNMSYSYYLLHGLALNVGFRLLHHAIPTVSHEALFFVAMLLPMFIVTLVPTITLYLFVERPFSLGKPKRQPEMPRGLREQA
jgi:exopolysaccharide production protein ExoZ